MTSKRKVVRLKNEFVDKMAILNVVLDQDEITEEDLQNCVPLLARTKEIARSLNIRDESATRTWSILDKMLILSMIVACIPEHVKEHVTEENLLNAVDILFDLVSEGESIPHDLLKKSIDE